MATEEENYVRAARMKARIERVQAQIRKEMEAQAHCELDESDESGGMAPPTTARRGSLVDALVANPEAVFDPGGESTKQCTTLVEAIDADDLQAAEALLSAGQYDMGIEDVNAVQECLKKWPGERNVVWKGCAVLACIAGDHGQAGADAVSKALKSVVRAAKHHADDPIVQRNVLNALRWVSENASPNGKRAVLAYLDTVQAAMALHPNDKWTQAHGQAVMTVLTAVAKGITQA